MIQIGTMAIVLPAAAGCSTVAAVAQHSALDVQSQVSNSIFLEPVSPTDQTVYLRVRNTSGKSELHIAESIRSRLQAGGWVLARDPDEAKVLLLQINILQAGKAEKSAIAAAMQSGYGGGFLGSGAVGAGVAAVSGSNARGIGAIGLAAGAADYVGGLLVENVYYSTVADVQIARRGEDGETFTVTRREGQSGTNAQGAMANLISMATGRSSTIQSQQNSATYTETSEFKTQRTRVMASAEKVNLDWEVAAPALSDQLAAAIGGML